MQSNHNHPSRRDTLRAGLAAGALGLLAHPSLAATIPVVPPKRKLLLIFLRGAYDAVNTIIPHADAEYTQTNRGPTFIDAPFRLPILGNTHFSLNPSVAHIQPIVNAGRLVFLHASGNTARTGSHFEDQRTWETGISQCSTPAGFTSEEGWVTRASSLFGQGFRTACVSDTLQQFFQTRNSNLIQSQVRRIRSFPDDALTQYTLASLKPNLDPKFKDPIRGLRALFGTLSGPGLDAYSRKLGIAMLDSEAQIAQIASTPYIPLGGARYPFGKAPNDPLYPRPTDVGLMSNSASVTNWFQNVRDAMWLLRKSDARIVGIHIGGFDTHSEQGGVNASGNLTGPLAQQIQAVAYALRSIDMESQDPAFAQEVDGLTTLVVSEFGRTSKANSSNGTDHGGATCVWAMGSQVLWHPNSGPVYNGTIGIGGLWPGMLSANDADFGCTPTVNTQSKFFVKAVTDFRVVFREVLEKVLLASTSQVDQIIPGASTAGSMLGFL